MKKYLVLVAMSVLLACSSRAGFVVKGVFKNAGDGIAVLTYTGETKKCDTVQMKNGKFEFKGEVPYVWHASLMVVPQGEEAVTIGLMLENSRIELQGNWDNVGLNDDEVLEVSGMTITGSKNTEVDRALNGMFMRLIKKPEHKEFYQLMQETITHTEILEDTAFYWEYRRQFDCFEALVKAEQLRIMAENPSVEAAANYLGSLMDFMPLEEVEQIFGQFDERVRQSELAREVREQIALRQRIEPGRPAPAFTLAQRDGKRLSLSDYRGKVVVLDFWASWCKPCRASFTWVREFYKEFHDKGVEIIGISIDENWNSWEKALDAEQLPWPQVIDKEREDGFRVDGLYHVLAVPMFVVIDKDGNIVVCEHMERERLEAVVDGLLAK